MKPDVTLDLDIDQALALLSILQRLDSGTDPRDHPARDTPLLDAVRQQLERTLIVPAEPDLTRHEFRP